MMKVLVLVLWALLHNLALADEQSSAESSTSAQQSSVAADAKGTEPGNPSPEALPTVKADNLALFAGAAQVSAQQDDNAAKQNIGQSSLSFSAADNSLVKPSSPDIYGQLSTMMMGLCLVLLVIFALAWVVKKLNLPMTQQAGKLQIVATLPLSNKEKILLINVRGKELLVGVTANNISLLSELPAKGISELMDADDEETAEPRKEGDFAKKLYQVLSKGNLK